MRFKVDENLPASADSQSGGVMISTERTPTPEAVAEFCARWGVEELALFGSVLRDDFGPDSDVDVLVRFSPAARRTLTDRLQMEEELRALFGRPVDLVDRDAVEASPNYLRRREILSTAETLYGP